MGTESTDVATRTELPSARAPKRRRQTKHERHQPQHLPGASRRLYSRPQARAFLGIGEYSYRQLVLKGKLREIRIGHSTLRVTEAELERFLAECMEGTE
jgi:hypothetical protein